MRRKRLVELVTMLARALDARLASTEDDGLPIDPSLLPVDLAPGPMTR